MKNDEENQAPVPEARPKTFRSDPERRREYRRQYYLRNREKMRSQSRAWQDANPDIVKAIQQRYDKRYYANNSGKVRARAAAYNRENWIRKAWRTLAARANGAPCATLQELQALFDTQGGRCAFSFLTIGYGTAHLDHKVPKALGGGHMIHNLQWLHRQVNLMKHTMSMDEFDELFERVVKARANRRG